MDAHSDLALSGRTFIAKVSFAPPDVLRAAVADGAMIEDGRQPMAGDLRLSATVAPEHRGKPPGNAVCAGSLSASIFDGVCWQRFDLASLTTMGKFTSADQLRAVLGWATHTTRDASGRACKRSTNASGLPIYELSPLATAIVVPTRSASASGHSKG